MLKPAELKNWLHRDLSRADKVLLVMASDESPWQVAEIKARAEDAGLREIRKWNVSQIAGGTNGLAISTPKGWELTDAGKQHLRNLGVAKISPAAVKVASDLRNMLAKVKDDDTRAFVQEAVECYELELYRSAVVMAWLAAVHVLRRVIVQHHLSAFNTEAARVDAKWKPAKTSDDLGRMPEGDFLDRMAAISAIGKNVKEELHKCLKLRNGCGHPNTLKVSTNTVASLIEILLLNVFQPFAK